MKWFIGEMLVNLSILLDRLKTSWVYKRWISDKEYYKEGN